MPQTARWSENQIAMLRAQLRAIQLLREIDQRMPLALARTLIEVAVGNPRNEPWTVTELADHVGIPQPTLTRHMQAYGDGCTNHGIFHQGHGLVTMVSRGQYTDILLTRKGRTLLANVVAVLTKAADR